MGTSTFAESASRAASKPQRESPGAGDGGAEATGLVLEIEHLTKRYGRNVVVDDVSFVVHPGRVTGFLGPNGSGKSTTMKVLLDLASADQGRATIGGTRYRDLRDPARTVGVVLEPNAFHPARSARKHLAILADIAGLPTSRVDEVLDVVGLAEAADRHAGAYSLGMKQRLSLAAALLGDPPVLVLDEPGNGLDPQGIRALRDLLRARADQGHTVFLSSHLLAEVEHLADEVIVLNRGKLVTSGPLHELQAAAIRVRCSDPTGLDEALRAQGAVVEVRGPDGLVVRTMAMDEVGDVALAAGIAIHELTADTSSLEDLFLSWTGEGPSMGPHPRSEGAAP
jgi:ABC-2 type transport system ATP-binding protein